MRSCSCCRCSRQHGGDDNDNDDSCDGNDDGPGISGYQLAAWMKIMVLMIMVRMIVIPSNM